MELIFSAGFITWLDGELDSFCERIQKQIFSPSTPLEIISSCLAFVRDQCVKMREAGLDVTYLIDSRFRRNIERTVRLERARILKFKHVTHPNTGTVYGYIPYLSRNLDALTSCRRYKTFPIICFLGEPTIVVVSKKIFFSIIWTNACFKIKIQAFPDFRHFPQIETRVVF